MSIFVPIPGTFQEVSATSTVANVSLTGGGSVIEISSSADSANKAHVITGIAADSDEAATTDVHVPVSGVRYLKLRDNADDRFSAICDATETATLWIVEGHLV